MVYGEFSKQRADSKPSAFGACASFLRIDGFFSVKNERFVTIVLGVDIRSFSSFRKCHASFIRLNFDVRYRDYCE